MNKVGKTQRKVRIINLRDFKGLIDFSAAEFDIEPVVLLLSLPVSVTREIDKKEVVTEAVPLLVSELPKGERSVNIFVSLVFVVTDVFSLYSCVSKSKPVMEAETDDKVRVRIDPVVSVPELVE